MLQFWEVKTTGVLDNDIANVMFVVAAKETVRFLQHFQCYGINIPLRKRQRVVYSKNFVSYLPLNLIKSFGQTRSKYVCLQHEIDMA